MQDLELLYEESLDLIDSCPDLKTDKIPDHLLSIWLYNGYVQVCATPEQLVSVAIYKYANDKYGDPALSDSDDRHRYETFQYILATEYACRKVSAKFRPRKIFDFSTYDNPLHVDMKRNQVAKFQRLAATLVPLQYKLD